VTLVDRDPVRLPSQRGTDDLGERVLRLETQQDRVVAGDRRYPAFLERDEAVCSLWNADADRVRLYLLDRRKRR
jgi:hypothetical protein